MSELGDVISKRRKQLELTLEQVGQAVGVSKSTVKKWESGYISNMRRDKIAALAKVLQMSPAELILLTNSEPETSLAKAKLIKIVEAMSEEDCEAVLRLLSKQ